MNTLAEYLATHNKCKGFVPGKPYFSEFGFVTVYWEDERCYAESCGDIDIMKANSDGRVVGVKIYLPKVEN